MPKEISQHSSATDVKSDTHHANGNTFRIIGPLWVEPLMAGGFPSHRAAVIRDVNLETGEQDSWMVGD